VSRVFIRKDSEMNRKEISAIRRVVRDMTHDADMTESFIQNKGGLAVEAFIERVRLRVRDLNDITVGNNERGVFDTE